MKHNVGTLDRWVRAVAGLTMASLALMLPLSPLLRLAGLGLPGGYLVISALAGTCLGYRMLGRSTCALRPS